MITKNFDAMMRTITFGRIWPEGISNTSNLTETHYLQDNNTVVKAYYPPTYNIQPYAQPTNAVNFGTMKYIQLGEQTSADEVIPAENYYDYSLTHKISSTDWTTLSAGEVTFITENNVDYLRIKHTFNNTSSKTYLVREIGIIAQVNMESWTTNNGRLLLYRKVLPNYQTWEPNGNLIVDLKIPLTELAPNKPTP